MEKRKNNLIPIIDIRTQRPIILRFEKEKKNATLQMSDSANIYDKIVSFYTPNNVSLFLSSAKKELSKAKGIHKSLFGKVSKLKDKRLRVSDRDIPRLYNYFESIQLAIVSTYTAIESFANICIPKDFVYEKKNSKGVKELYDKDLIERYIPTSEKIDKILPAILGCESPKGNKLWQDFKELESHRNDIIHPKTKKRNEELKEDSSFLCELLSDKFFDKVESCFLMISYFCEKNTSHSLFPMGFGEVKFEPVDFDGKNFERVDVEGEEVELPT